MPVRNGLAECPSEEIKNVRSFRFNEPKRRLPICISLIDVRDLGDCLNYTISPR